MEKFISIAIDGPSGSGKSTLAKLLASRLGYVYIDTGALYRTIGYFVRNEGVASDDERGIVECLPKIDITMKLVGGAGVVFLGGNPVGTEIRTSEISTYASNVSKIPEVRAFLLDLQRNIAKSNNVIMDGRDIGTVVLPDSQVKVFLTASNDSRAERRYAELVARGDDVTLEQVKADLCWRDKNDLERKIAPAVPAEDSVMLDNSALSCEETVEAVLEIIRKKTH
ncbi:MAG: (d)CMP kinase [Ruminococcaceae bacterium]|nr:(d)CMP kinase [Oscillospiraceae bacterium]